MKSVLSVVRSMADKNTLNESAGSGRGGRAELWGLEAAIPRRIGATTRPGDGRAPGVHGDVEPRGRRDGAIVGTEAGSRHAGGDRTSRHGGAGGGGEGRGDDQAPLLPRGLEPREEPVAEGSREGAHRKEKRAAGGDPTIAVDVERGEHVIEQVDAARLVAGGGLGAHEQMMDHVVADRLPWIARRKEPAHGRLERTHAFAMTVAWIGWCRSPARAELSVRAVADVAWPSARPTWWITSSRRCR